MAAEMTGFAHSYIRNLCANGTIKAEKLGHDWLMTESAVLKIKRQRKPKVKKVTDKD